MASPKESKTLGSLSIRYLPDTKVLDRYLIAVDLKVLAIWDTVRRHYIAVNFHPNAHKRHPIARTYGVSFVNITSDVYFTSVIVILYAK